MICGKMMENRSSSGRLWIKSISREGFAQIYPSYSLSSSTSQRLFLFLFLHLHLNSSLLSTPQTPLYYDYSVVVAFIVTKLQ